MDLDDASTAARMRSLARLARPTAHEVNGALSAIQLHLELLATVLDDSADPSVRERRARYLRVLSDESRRLGRLADAFLDLAVVPGGAAETDLAALVTGVVDATRPLAVARRVALELGQVAPRPRTLADREGCRQRLLDAVLDALVVARAGSTVRVGLLAEGEGATVEVEGDAGARVVPLGSEARKDA
jgi:signal transduction histidine kinase